MAKLLNVEIKARLRDEARVRQVLRERNAIRQGEDRQIDTYYRCPNGRLKLRQSVFGDQLVFYKRQDQAGPKTSNIQLAALAQEHELGALLADALGVLVVVAKKREIFWINNIKIHLDQLENLGEFLEIEVIDDTGNIENAVLEQQCRSLMTQFGILEEDLLTHSYSDMYLQSV